MADVARLVTRTAVLSLAAAAVHLVLVPDHFEEWWGYGAFFMLAATAQAVYGFAMLYPRLLHGEPITRLWPLAMRRRWYVLGIAGNLLLVAMYVVSRTVGVPFFGPEAGEVEPWDALGVATKAAELVLVAFLAALLARDRA